MTKDESFSDEFKNSMIVIFVNPRTYYFKSYNLGTKEIIVEKYISKGFKYGYPLLTYLAVARTILKCREIKMQGFHIFTTVIAARWIHEGGCDSKMLNESSIFHNYLELRKKVLEITTEIQAKPLPEIRIWNEKWGIVSINLDANNFEISPVDILKYVPYSYRSKKKKDKKGKLPPFGDPFEW